MRFRELADRERLAEWHRAIARNRKAYRDSYGRGPQLARPRRFSEKMQWRKLFDLDPRYAILSDKAASRDFIARTVGSDYLPELLHLGDDPEAIPFETLQPPYVVKSTHGAGQLMRVREGGIDAVEARMHLRGWLTFRHGALMDEPGYIHVPPRIIVERMILNRDGTPPIERRMFTFAGRVQVTQTTVVDNGVLRPGAFHDRDWRLLPWRGPSEPHPGPFPRPERYDAMIAIAERLGAGFDHVRVDLYDADDRIYAGELTLYSWSGLTPLDPDDADRQLGEYWPLQRPVARAAAAVLLRRRTIPHPESDRTVTSTPMPR